MYLELRENAGIKYTVKLHKDARPLRPDEKINWNTYWGDQKLDGYYSAIYTDEDAKISKIVSRNNRDVSNQAGYKELIEKQTEFHEALLLGEFIPQTGKLFLFDIIQNDGKDLRSNLYRTRRSILEKSKHFNLTNLYKNNLKRAYYNEVESGGEGLVLKNPDANYNADDWVKWKSKITVDYIIVGFVFRPTGIVKAIRLGVKEKNIIHEVGLVGTMENSIRDTLSKEPKKYIGTIIEVIGQGLWRSLAMKHPSVVRLRPDLSKEHVSLEKYKTYPKIGEDNWEKMYKVGMNYIHSKKLNGEIVGSIIRAKYGRPHPTIKDIDIVILNSKEARRVYFDKYLGYVINVFVAHDKGEYAMTKFHFQMGKGIISIKAVAKKKGYKLTRYGLYKSEKLITQNPNKVIDILGVKVNVKLDT